jgi:Zn-dependent protease
VDLKLIILAVPALLFSLSFHELAHAWVATRLGDTTPTRQGRLTLSPLAHLDPFGSVIFPGIALLLNAMHIPAPFFGWAKPVEFVPTNFTRRVTMWQGTALCALAGPASNLVLALVSALVLRLVVLYAPQLLMGRSLLVDAIALMIQLNVMLAFFNLVPVPPLDGSHLWPRAWTGVKEFAQRYSFILFILLFFVKLPGTSRPLAWLVIGPLIDQTVAWLMMFGGLA